jgi:hypothetical protein
MTEMQETRPTPMGIYDQPKRSKMTPGEMIMVLVCFLWLFGAGLFFLLLSDPDVTSNTNFDPLRFVMIILAVFMPVAMIWVAMMAARSARVIREESTRLQAAIDAIRQSYIAEMQRNRGLGPDASVTKKLDEIAAAQRKTETALATFHSIRTATMPTRPEPEEDEDLEDQGQGDLPLGTEEDDNQPPLSRDTFVRALNFPETAEDEEGFVALRKALKDRQSAHLIQAAQDVLTLLSQDGIYMDDLRPDLARPEIWRRFAGGERGRAIAALGGIRDRSSLALSAGRMKQDPIFRDAAHHFLRRFDKMFLEFEKTATDQEITDLAETRTSRAFMLLGRVAGIFD